MKHSMTQTEKRLSFNNLDKYEYLTGEDLGLKPSTVEQAKFEYFLLGKIFNKGLDKDEDKKEGLLKRLKNTEDKNEKQLKEIRNQTENIQEVTDFVKKPLSLEAKKLIDKIRVIQKDVDYRKLKITGGNKTEQILVITKHLKGYLETFTTKGLQQMMQKDSKKNLMQ